MIKTILTFLLPLLFFTSCSKHIEDRLIGEWKLDVSYRKELFGRDYFTTGYENGIFRFHESGSADYISNTDTLSGYWEADTYPRYHYNSSTGETETNWLKYLRIYLINFQRNKIIDWEFDEFNFRNGWKCIRGVQYSFGRDRYYEFIRS